MYFFFLFSSLDYCPVMLNYIMWCIHVSVHWSEALL